MFSLSTAQIQICKQCKIWGLCDIYGRGVGTDGRALGFSGVSFCPGIRLSWEVNFARSFLTSSDFKKCVRFDKRVNKKWRTRPYLPLSGNRPYSSYIHMTNMGRLCHKFIGGLRK